MPLLSVADDNDGDKKKKDKKKKKGEKEEKEKEKKKGPSKATVKAMQEALAKMKEEEERAKREEEERIRRLEELEAKRKEEVPYISLWGWNKGESILSLSACGAVGELILNMFLINRIYLGSFCVKNASDFLHVYLSFSRND